MSGCFVRRKRAPRESKAGDEGQRLKSGRQKKGRWWQCDLDSDTELPLAPGMVCWNEHKLLRLFRPAISYLELCTNVPNISSPSIFSHPFFLWLTRGPFDPDLSPRTRTSSYSHVISLNQTFFQLKADIAPSSLIDDVPDNGAPNLCNLQTYRTITCHFYP